MREVQRKQGAQAQAQAIAVGGAPDKEPAGATALGALQTLLERAKRIRTQQPHDKNKLYALHAPEVECIGKGKARKPYEFGVKASLAVTHKQALMVGARAFPGNPFDGHTLAQQLEQTTNLLQETWDASPSRPSWTWATGAWTPTTRALRSSIGASTRR